MWVNPAERQAFISRLKADGHVHGLEARFRMKSGAIGTAVISAARVELSGRQHLLATGVDLTQNNRVEAELRESEAIKRQALNSTPDVVFAIDHGYQLLSHNDRLERLLSASGCPPLHVGDCVLSPAYSEPMLAFWRAAYDRSLQGEQFSTDTEWSDEDGTRRFSENNFTPLRNFGGTIIGVLVVVHDVTERKQTVS